MSWRGSLSSGWARGLVLSAAVLLLLASLTSGYSAAVCLAGKACHGDCCPDMPAMCVADTAAHEAVAAPGALPSFRPAFLGHVSFALALPPWHLPLAATGFPSRGQAFLRSDPGRVPEGPFRPALGVWVI